MPRTSDTGSGGARVLVIEDDPMIGRAVVAGLQDAGYTVDWVRDGAEAELALVRLGSTTLRCSISRCRGATASTS